MDTEAAIQPGRVGAAGRSEEVGSTGGYSFANSSALRSRSGNKKLDSTAVFKDSRKIAKFRMPRRNVQSIYIDYKRGTYSSITEISTLFLFTMPLKRIIKRAEREERRPQARIGAGA